jgi:hypothetical protein
MFADAMNMPLSQVVHLFFQAHQHYLFVLWYSWRFSSTNLLLVSRNSSSTSYLVEISRGDCAKKKSNQHSTLSLDLQTNKVKFLVQIV